MTDDNFKYYLLAIVIAPCIFYVPKFFELYAEETRVGVDIEVNCHSVLNPPKVNLTAWKGTHCLKITQNVAFEFWHFPPIFVLLKLTCLVTLFDSPKLTIFGIFN